MKKNSTNLIVFYNILSTVILYAITFFSSPIFSRMLGTNQYGIVQVYNTWLGLFSIVIGLMTRGILPMARVKYAEEEQLCFQSSAMGLSIASFLGVSLVVLMLQRYIISFTGLNLSLLFVLLLHSFGSYCILFINAKFTYELKARSNLLLSVAIALLTFGLSFAFMKGLPADRYYIGRILGMAVPYTVAGICIIIYMFRQGKLFYSSDYWKFMIPLCLPLIFHSISGVICSSGDRIMIQKMMSNSAVGIYTLAYNFANIMNSIWLALNNSWTPFMVDYIKNSQYEILKKKSANYIQLYTCLCLGFILLSPEVFRMYADPAYWKGAAIIPIIVLGQFANFSYAFASNYEFCFMRTDFVAIGSVISGISNVALNFIFIPVWGYFGAALTTLISNLILVFCHVCFARKLAKDKWVYSFKMFLPSVIGLSIIASMYYLCFDLWLARWILAIVVGIYMLLNVYRRKSIF